MRAREAQQTGALPYQASGISRHLALPQPLLERKCDLQWQALKDFQDMRLSVISNELLAVPWIDHSLRCPHCFITLSLEGHSPTKSTA
jgi:hypothetical protein